MQTVATSPTPARKAGNVHDREYRSFLKSFAKRFNDNLGGDWLFTTDAPGLWEAYLASFPESQRQFHNCCACRHFIERFGGLVTIAEDGSTASAVWLFTDEVPDEYRAGFRAMEKVVRKAKVTGVFLSSEPELGQSLTGNFRHMSVPNPGVYKKRGLLTAGQAAAEKREDHHNVMRALAEFTAPMVDQALTLLKTDSLYRSEKVMGPAQWLAELHAAIATAPGRKSNVVWRAIAAAPAGFCHPRSSMVGTLLEDIAAGKDFAEVSRAFKAKMHPLLYQRPQAPPSAGNIAQAEKIFAELGIANALKRRFARLEEVETIWKPAHEPKRENGGVFSHLKAKDAPSNEPLITTPQNITWEKFARTVLPDAKALELLVPHHGNFCALLTAEDPEAPPILQWDLPERRNPFSWYVYHGGSSAAHWGISMGWTRVAAVALQPSAWFGGDFPHHGGGALFVLPGARDSRADSVALFPETLKSELHQVRSTIEAYSRGAKPSGQEEASANGLVLSKGGGSDVTVRAVLANGTRVGYRIDRWD